MVETTGSRSADPFDVRFIVPDDRWPAERSTGQENLFTSPTRHEEILTIWTFAVQ
jgi:hypothetical protein